MVIILDKVKLKKLLKWNISGSNGKISSVINYIDENQVSRIDYNFDSSIEKYHGSYCWIMSLQEFLKQEYFKDNDSYKYIPIQSECSGNYVNDMKEGKWWFKFKSRPEIKKGKAPMIMKVINVTGSFNDGKKMVYGLLIKMGP